MYNNITELLKLVYLSQFNIDLNHSTFHIDMSTNEITLHLYINSDFRDCPYCKSKNSIIHARILKRIYHPVIENRICIIILHQIKFKCNECGHFFMQFNPLVSGSKNISKIGELYILERLRKTRKTFKDISNELYIPHTSVIRCFDEHVSINRHPLTKVLCFDEIFAAKLTATKYAFVIFDPISSTILDVLDARLKDCLTDYFARIPIKERLKVEYFNIDMWETYKVISHQSFPNATVCVDTLCKILHKVSYVKNIVIIQFLKVILC